MGVRHISRMAEYLRNIGWSDTDIVSLICYMGDEKPLASMGQRTEETYRQAAYTGQPEGGYTVFERADEKKEPGYAVEDEDLDQTYVMSAEELDDAEDPGSTEGYEEEDPETLPGGQKANLANEDPDPESYEEQNNDGSEPEDADDFEEQEPEAYEDEDYEEPDEGDYEEPDGEDYEEPSGEEYEESEENEYDEEPDDELVEDDFESLPDNEDAGKDDDGESEDDDEAAGTEDLDRSAVKAGAEKDEKDNEDEGAWSADRYPGIGSPMHKSEFTFSFLDITITGGNGKKVSVQVVTTPVDIMGRSPQIFGCCTIDRKRDIAVVSERDSSSLTIRAEGFPLTIEGHLEDGRYTSVCSIPEHYIQEGTVIKQNEKSFGENQKGHIICGDSGVYVHILPMSFKNNPEQTANIVYCVENEDGINQNGVSNAKRQGVIYHNGRKLKVTSRWDEKTSMLYSLIK